MEELPNEKKFRKDEHTESGIRILYEDNHLLVVEKPVNMPVQADVSGDPDLLTLLKEYLRARYGKPGEAYLGLVHRLDRPVGGAMVFAKTSKAAARLGAQFASREAKKRYCAIVRGRPKSVETLADWLYKDETTFSSRVVAPETEGAKQARMSYALLGQAQETALLDIELGTGRPHQIRVQLQNAGYPIVGDQRYGVEAQPGEQIRLWAYALTLSHPTQKESMTFFSAPPWNEEAFSAQIALLPAFSVCRGVYLNGDCVVVDKHAGVETEGELLGELESLFESVYPVHRLDANTEGLVLFARTEEAAARYEELFFAHNLRKIYHAVVRGVPDKTGRLVHWVVKNAEDSFVRLCREGEPEALRCELSYRVLQSNGETSLLEIELFTGRTHQIRVQMAAIGHPVLGDDKYGDREFNKLRRKKTQQLLAKRLEIDGHVFESLRELEL
ncbi:MAG: pseudouridine synthase [Christensenella sp.]